MAADTLLVDTNVLLEATDEKRRHHATARRLIEGHPRLVLSAQIVREYLVVATRPVGAANGLGLSPSDALDNIRAFRERVRLLREERPVLPILLRLVAESRCSGKRIHDAHVVATAVSHSVPRIVTLNVEDFRGFAQHVEPITPGELDA
jgi:predicted nucleic acid-binding protein